VTGFSPQPTEMGDQRAEALRAGLSDVRERVARACDAAGRDPAEVTVIVVTKFFPASDVRRLAALGVRDMGENRDQEASAKFADVKADTAGLRLHFIGQIQTNKAASVASYADVVHTVDRLKLVTALDRGAAAADRRLRVLVQVDLDPARPAATLGAVATAAASAGPARGGADPADVGGLVAAVQASAALDLLGVMAVAPLGVDPGPAFGRLADVSRAVRAVVPDATWISAGMSGDLEVAIRHGATHLRVGTAILGSRPTLR
jgi:uncharacterized pyridoxal phosphate-containing UPF0001 family protein